MSGLSKFVLANYGVSLLMAAMIGLSGCSKKNPLSASTSSPTNSATTLNVHPAVDSSGHQNGELKCPVDPKLGESSYQNLTSEHITQLDFGKKLDISRMERILPLSLNASTKFIVESGRLLPGDQKVQLFKMPTPTNHCSALAVLPVAPNDLSKVFGLVDNEAGQKDGRVLGMYFGLDFMPEELTTNDTVAAIVVRDDVGKWTLSHEFMHHLFNSEMIKSNRAGRSVALSDLRKRTQKLTASLGSLNSKFNDPNLSFPELIMHYKTLTTIVSDLFKTSQEIQVRFPLEESTIEKYLIVSYFANKLVGVTRSDLESAAQYLIYSLKKVDGELQVFEKMVPKLKSQVEGLKDQYGLKMLNPTNHFRSEYKQAGIDLIGANTIVTDFSNGVVLFRSKLNRFAGSLRTLDASISTHLRMELGLSGHEGQGEIRHEAYDRDVDELNVMIKDSLSEIL